MQKFHMSARPVEIKHFNTRTEGRGDDEQALAGDLKIKAVGSLEDLDNWLLGDRCKASYVFYSKGGDRRILGLGVLKIERKLEDLIVSVTTIEDKQYEFKGVTINGLQIELQDDSRIDLICSLQLDPTSHMEDIGNLLLDGRAEFEITAGQTEMDV